MNDLVWFGNYVIPRWEAFLLMGVGVVVAAILLVGFCIGIGYIVAKLTVG